MSKQKEDSQVKQGNNSSTASGAITEKQREILRSCLYSIAVVNWVLPTVIVNKEGDVDKAKLMVLRFFIHIIGSQLEQFKNSSGRSIECASGTPDGADYLTQLFSKNRLKLAHSMRVTDILAPIYRSGIKSIENNVRELKKYVHKLLPGEKMPIFDKPGYIPQIKPSESIGTTNVQYILGVIEMAEQVLDKSPNSVLSPIQHYLGVLCIELVGNNLREIRKEAYKKGLTLDDLGLKDLHIRVKNLRNSIAHCSSIQEITKIPVIWDLKYLIGKKSFFASSPNSSILASDQNLVTLTQPVDTTTLSTATAQITSTATTTTTTVTAITTTTTSVLTTATAPAVIANAPVIELIPSTSSTLTEAEPEPEKENIDIRKMNALPVGYTPDAWELVEKAIEENKALLAKIRAVDDTLAELKSLNHMSTEQIMIVLVRCMKNKEYELFDEMIAAFGRRVDWSHKVQPEIRKDKDQYLAYVKVAGIEYAIIEFEHDAENKFGQPIEFGTLAVTGAHTFSGINKLIEIGISPWQLFNCDFMQKAPFINFLDTNCIIPLQKDVENVVNKNKIHHLQGELLQDFNKLRSRARALYDQEVEEFKVTLEEYKLANLVSMEGIILPAITYWPALLKLFPEKSKQILTGEITKLTPKGKQKVMVSIISSLSADRVMYMDFASFFISSIHNIYAHLGIQTVQAYILQPGVRSSIYRGPFAIMLEEYQDAEPALTKEKMQNSPQLRSLQDDPLIYMAVCEVFRDINDVIYSNIRQFIYDYDVYLLQIMDIINLDPQAKKDIAAALQQPIALDKVKLAQFGLTIPGNQISFLQLMRRMQILPPGVLSEVEIMVDKVNNQLDDEQSKSIEAVSESIMQDNKEAFIAALGNIKDVKLLTISLCTALSSQQCSACLALLHSAEACRADMQKSSKISIDNLSLLSISMSLKDTFYNQEIGNHMRKLMQMPAAQSQEKERG